MSEQNEKNYRSAHLPHRAFYVTCFNCKRDFELEWDEEAGRMSGVCPVCKTVYDIKLSKAK